MSNPPNPKRIDEAHSYFPKTAAEQTADHGDELGFRHRQYTQSQMEDCYICTLLRENAELRKRLAAPEERSVWIPLLDRLPDNDVICMITDGKEIGLASAWRVGYGHRKPYAVSWGPCGFGGYEWEWDFDPTHWMPLPVSLPQSNEAQNG